MGGFSSSMGVGSSARGTTAAGAAASGFWGGGFVCGAALADRAETPPPPLERPREPRPAPATPPGVPPGSPAGSGAQLADEILDRLQPRHARQAGQQHLEVVARHFGLLDAVLVGRHQGERAIEVLDLELPGLLLQASDVGLG